MEKDIFYVYVYLDQRKSGSWLFNNLKFDYQPFYVGKGKKNRIKHHFWESCLKKNTLTANKIKKILSDCGEYPLHYRIFENLNETEAFEIEKEIINFFGRVDNKSGILTNHTDGGEGHSGCHLPKYSKRKVIFQYDLNGNFIKKWGSICECAKSLKIIQGNIATSIKRNGTAGGFIWSYFYMGKKIKSKIKSQMPCKYENIKQYDLNGNLLNVFPNVHSAAKILTNKTIKQAINGILKCLRFELKKYEKFIWKL